MDTHPLILRTRAVKDGASPGVCSPDFDFRAGGGMGEQIKPMIQHASENTLCSGHYWTAFSVIRADRSPSFPRKKWGRSVCCSPILSTTFLATMFLPRPQW